ncbi:hypothetical protein R6Z07F_011139 [Ovis aries]
MRPCGGQCGPKACPKGPRPCSVPDPFPDRSPCLALPPGTPAPAVAERLSADGRGGVRGFTTEMKADPWRAVPQRAETWDERNNHASSRVRLAYFGHFSSRERGRPGTPGASEELLGVPSRSVGETAAARTVTPAAPEKTRRVGRWEPPILPSSAAEPARLLRKFAVGAQGAIAWPPRSRAGAPEGRGQGELSGSPRSPTPLRARRP